EFARLRIELRRGGVLPEPMHAARHGVVHHVVFRRDRRKHLAHAPRLFGLRHVLEPKMCGLVTHGATIAAGPGRGYIGRRCFRLCVPTFRRMPELPEVETVRRGLAPALVGRRIKRARTKRADLRFPFPTRFAARLSGRRVDALERRAKYLLAHLDDGNVWVTHLGMTGRWSVIGAKRQPGDFYYAEPTDPTHTHVIIDMEEGGRLEFNDPRRFGYMDLIPEAAIDAHPFFKAMG